MKIASFFVIITTLGLAWSLKDGVSVVRSEQDIQPPGTFHYNYELSDESKSRQNGSIGSFYRPKLQVEGEYSYITDDGDRVRVTYTAGPLGFKPTVYINDVLQ